eukprot:TRINITY_DN29167_c0_g1_i1.p2 TRINITY_DN29167_c0_g1~~TRINITY_DN29167_c0_g1_i1.p2  ORF type:complete len:117 (-),score=31.71 TRINITY_DN29167_c0_g1_i1:28-378(-)
MVGTDVDGVGHCQEMARYHDYSDAMRQHLVGTRTGAGYVLWRCLKEAGVGENPGVMAGVAGVANHVTRMQLVSVPVSYTHLRAHETVLDLVCRLLLEKKKNNKVITSLWTSIGGSE